MKIKKDRYIWIDALRGYGALTVMLCHLIQRLVTENMIATNEVTTYFLNGARAVQMFFIFTGMTTFISLSRNCGGGGVLVLFEKKVVKTLSYIYIDDFDLFYCRTRSIN